MKKLIKQDLAILLSLIAAYHPQAGESIENAARTLDCQTTRDHLLLLRGGKCRVCKYADAFQPNSPDNLFWLADDEAPALALHLHITRMARESPEGSVVILDYATMREAISRIMDLPGPDRVAVVRDMAHRSLTHNQMCSTLDFIRHIRGGDEAWT